MKKMKKDRETTCYATPDINTEKNQCFGGIAADAK